MKITVSLDKKAISRLEKAAHDAAAASMEALRTDLVQSQTMPFDTGNMQNNDTFAERTENGAVLVTGSPQARRLYYHPEYNFQKKNVNAGAYWLEPYISGEKKEILPDAFVRIFKEKTGI